MSINLNNLAITATNAAMTSAIGGMFDKLQSIIANGGRDRNCKFYYNNGAGGSILQVAVKGVVGGAVSALKDEADNAFNSYLNGKKGEKKKFGRAWIDSELPKQETEAKEYGLMKVEGGTVYALDDWGGVAPEALMLGIELDQNITITQSFPAYRTQAIDAERGIYKELPPQKIPNMVITKTLVWYDTTDLPNP